MKRRLAWTMAGTLLLAIVGFWVLSGFSLEGTMTHDLINPTATQELPSWRFRAGQVILPLLYSHDTRYARDYREDVFVAIKTGADQAAVRAAIGEPFNIRQFDDGRSMWYYSRAGVKTQHYLLRVVEFDAAGKVRRKHAEFYVD